MVVRKREGTRPLISPQHSGKHDFFTNLFEYYHASHKTALFDCLPSGFSYDFKILAMTGKEQSMANTETFTKRFKLK